MNENMELVNTVEENVDNYDVMEDSDSGMNAGVAMLIGAGLGIAAVTAGKKLINKVKAIRKKKEEEDEDNVVDVDFEDAEKK